MPDSTIVSKTRPELVSPRRRALIAAGLCAALPIGCASRPLEQPEALAQGIVWQVDDDHLDPHGDWDRLGVTDLLVQWTAVDDLSFLPGTATHRKSRLAGLAPSEYLPDWARIAGEPWARNVIVGLAGRFDETTARARVARLIAQSKQLASVLPPAHIDGYYFPVEVDPTWAGARALGPLLEQLPRPLWISVYENSNIGGPALADWLTRWLPPDVGVFLQDGCGVGVRGPAAARAYADALTARRGKERTRIIAEAFRPAQKGAFRPATAAELAPQLLTYRGYRVYLFDGPHYVSAQLVRDLLQEAARR